MTSALTDLRPPLYDIIKGLPTVVSFESATFLVNEACGLNAKDKTKAGKAKVPTPETSYSWGEVYAGLLSNGYCEAAVTGGAKTGNRQIVYTTLDSNELKAWSVKNAKSL